MAYFMFDHIHSVKIHIQTYIQVIEHCLEKRSSAKISVRIYCFNNAVKRVILMIVSFHHIILYSIDNVIDICICINIIAYCKRIYKHSDHILCFCIFSS